MYPLDFLSTFGRSLPLLAITDWKCKALLYRIIPATAKWMAPQDPPQGHEKPAKNTVALDGINGILGTGRGKTTHRWKQGRNYELICPD